MEKDLVIDFTLLYNRYKKPLFNYLTKIVKSEMLAEDIAHNVFIKLYRSLADIRNRDRIEIWIFTTARNEAFGHFRKTKAAPEENLSLHEEQLSTKCCYDEYERNELIAIIEDELGKMDSQQSEVYYLKEYSGLSYKEVAQIMNITEDLVRSRLFKVRQKLKSVLIKLV
jgi:RNA polymerase sigma factor (sigma-70 family)